jgi:membrane-associated protease RseP (regulator of RpoE activity)
MVNLDTVGRTGEGITVFGAGSADFWPDLILAAARSAGVKSTPVRRSPGASDDQSFLESGVPALHLYSGPNPDYHRPSDTADRVEPTALSAAARLAGRLVLGLAALPGTATAAGSGQPGQASVQSPGHASVQPPGRSAGQPGSQPSARRVSLGTMPDLAFGGPGCRVAATSPGSPAHQAGILPGDVIMAIGDATVPDPRGLGQVLASHKPGDEVQVVVLRDGRERRFTVRLVAR